MHERPSAAVRLVFLSASGELGGAERSLLDILASFRAAQPAWSLHLLIAAQGPLSAAAESLGVMTTVLPYPASVARLGDSAAASSPLGRLSLGIRLLRAIPGAVRYARRMREALARLAPDLIHSNGFKMHVLGAVAARPQVPLVWHIHDFVTSRRIMASLLRRLSSRCAAAIANSDSVAADIRKALGDRVRVRRVYNAVDLERFTTAGAVADLDHLAGLPPPPPGTLRIGLIATLARWKGHDTFLDAVALLPRVLPVRAFLITGALYQTDGSQNSLDALRARAAALSIGDRVGFTGLLRDAPAAMRALDVVVHASTEPDPFGLVIAEAMACGRALVVSAAGGAAELVEPGVTALTHPPGDARALARALETLAADPPLRATLGRNAAAVAGLRFDRARLAGEIGEVYRVAGAAVA